MADAAVEFLLRHLKYLLLGERNLIKDVAYLLEQLEDDLRLLKAFLVDSAIERKKDDKLRVLIRQIRDVVYDAEDILDTFVIQAAALPNAKKYFLPFRKQAEITGQVEDVRRKIRAIYDYARTVDSASLKPEERHEPPEKNEVPVSRNDNTVGFDDEAEKLIGYLTEETDQLDAISIIGMGGLGKTTLARMIFHDPKIQFHFSIRIWVGVSQEFIKRDIFLSILKQFTGVTMDINCKSDCELADLAAMYLASRKFLLVMDDVWASEDWDKIQIALPKNNTKGKVLITSRNVEVGRYANRVRDPHMMRFLTLEESWLLLRLEVFGKPEFPLEIEREGKVIAERCGALPLAVVVIGRILVQEYFLASGETSTIKKVWSRVSESFNAYLNDHDTERRMENVLSLSYQKLPYPLRECFLYLGIFPQDYEISVSNLIRLWIAEGFIQQRDNISLEETAENYLADLIDRSLLRADKLKINGKVKTCRIHDLLHDFCRTQARMGGQNFFQEIRTSSKGDFHPPVSEGHKTRRLCIDSNVINFLAEKPYCPSVRTFVCFSRDEIPIHSEYVSAIPAGFKRLRVLDVMPFKFTKLPSEMFQLLHLRLMALSLTSAVLPAAFSKLWNLQTLIVYTTSPTLYLKVDVLNMIQLRHFGTNASATLPRTGKSNQGGENIQTLGTISPDSCTEEVFGKACNLKELGIRGRLASLLEDKEGSFNSLGKLDNLENLKLKNDLILCPASERKLCGLPPAYKFPIGLRRLTLCNTFLDWSHMYILGSLDKLEVLKLKDKAFWGKTWEVTDGGFQHLEVLHIGRTNLENWVASYHHFPRLKLLELRNCKNLKEVPAGLADIPNFQLLETHSSKLAAASAKKIQGIKRKQEE